MASEKNAKGENMKVTYSDEKGISPRSVQALFRRLE